MLIMKIQRGHRTGPKSLSFSLPRTVTALLSWEPMVATWKCLRLRNRILSTQTRQRTAKGVIYCTNDDLVPPKKNSADINAVKLDTKKITHLITGGINTYGSWSPDMKRIAFRRIIGDENSEVFVAYGDGSNPRNLTNNPFFDGWPAWSPDARTIAFASNRRGHGYQIFVMHADGSNVRLVANTEGRGTAPRWSPDGKTIYFTNCIAKDYGTDCEILMTRLDS